VGLINSFINDPRTPNIAATILRCLKGTIDFDLFFPRQTNQNKEKNGVVLEACSDSDWCEDRREKTLLVIY